MTALSFAVACGWGRNCFRRSASISSLLNATAAQLIAIRSFQWNLRSTPFASSGVTMSNEKPRNPAPTVDIIIELSNRPGRPIVLIERHFKPHGWAIPGGFLDYGESAEQGAVREAKEETSLDVKLLEQFYVYSDPKRDARKHTISVVFIAEATGTPKADDDAKNIAVHPVDKIPSKLCFDHGRILDDYRQYRETGQRPTIAISTK